MERLLQVRKELKERNPEFIRQDSSKRRRLGRTWRRPHGMHSKIRTAFKGRRKAPSSGYRSPVKVRGLHATGQIMVIVSSLNQLKSINHKTQGIIISKTVGMKKRLEILKKSKELKINVLNINVDEHMKRIEDFMGSKKKKHEVHHKKEDKKEEKKEERKEEKEHRHETKTPEESSEDEKKKKEKHEKDKLLTKKV